MSKPKLLTQACPQCEGSGQVPADNIGPVMREMREKAGVAGTALAEAMGISNEYLYDMERGGRRVSAKWYAEYISKLEELASVTSSK